MKNEKKNEIKQNKHEIFMNTTYVYYASEYNFENLPKEKLNKIYQDGRIFAFMIEYWLEANFQNLKHVDKKIYDFIHEKKEEIKYDEKTFTKRNCDIKPSKMKGKGRKTDQNEFQSIAKTLIYIIVSNVNFPEIKIQFIHGEKFLQTYPDGIIPSKDHDKFFNTNFIIQM